MQRNKPGYNLRKTARNGPNSANLARKPDGRKCPTSRPQASFIVLFSEGLIGSPVSKTPSGERNANHKSMFWRKRLDLVSFEGRLVGGKSSHLSGCIT